MKYLIAAVALVIVWLAVAVVVGLVVLLVFPTEGPTQVGIGPEPRNLPGTILGLAAGIYAWRLCLRKASAIAARKRQNSTPFR